MTLREVLLYKTNVHDLVLFIDGSRQIGCAIINHKDLFIKNIDSKLLEREVIDYYYITDWFPGQTMEVNIANNKEETKVKRQGFFTGKIYDENYPLEDIKECCRSIPNEEYIEKLNEERAKMLKTYCTICLNEKDCLRYVEI